MMRNDVYPQNSKILHVVTFDVVNITFKVRYVRLQ